ncbi:division/cell wall cluster transcriptional repressor MraZ [Gammaproteobacteria bacterium]|jgi:MraZ protein|nr:division/cell wall cluster transcriptional repressor MraZ [Gammaproteobacteria bacterium]
MFRGVNSLSLDVKGRLAIPTRYRDGLLRQSDGKMVVTINNAERCLWLYPLADWEEIERKLVSLPSLDAAAQRLKRILIGHANDCDLDAAGRVLLPGPLREFASLDKHVVMIGQGNKFEIWNEELWNERRDQWLTADSDLGPLSVEMESLSL